MGKQPTYSISLMRVCACTNKIKYGNIYMQTDVIMYSVKMYIYSGCHTPQVTMVTAKVIEFIKSSLFAYINK